MLSRSPMLSRVIVISVLMLGSLGLVAASSSLMEIHLFADFDSVDSAGGALKAEIGTLKQPPGDAVFDVLFSSADADDGVLRINANHTGSSASLRGELSSPVTASVAHVSFFLTPVNGYGDFFLSLSDEGDSGMIDLEFTPNGRVRVGAESRPIPGLPGDQVEVRLELRRALFGSMHYELTLEGPLGSEVMGGALGVPATALDFVDFVHPGSSNDAIWYVDDLLVTSSTPNPFMIFGGMISGSW